MLGRMTRVTFRSPSGDTVAVLDVRAGRSVMQAAVEANLSGIEAECGGSMTCSTCHVYVSEGYAALLPPPGADEAAMLDFVAAERRPTSRLSCQLVAADSLESLEVQLPERQVD